MMDKSKTRYLPETSIMSSYSHLCPKYEFMPEISTVNEQVYTVTLRDSSKFVLRRIAVETTDESTIS